MITFDAEDDSRGNIFLMGYYDGKKYTPFVSQPYTGKNYEPVYVPDLNQFRRKNIDFIIDSGDKVFIAHNLEYDLSHIFQGEYLTCIDWYYTNALIYATFVNTKIKFIDSFHFSYSKLSEIGKQIKRDKKSIDIENISELYRTDPDTVLYYNQIDCEIIYKYMSQFIDTIKEEFGIKIKHTLASTSQSIYLKHFSDYENIVGINFDKELLNGYYGGRVECFYTGKVDRTIYEMDVNSMYPFVMQNKFPVGEYFKSTEPVSEFYISKVRVKINEKTEIPVIPYRKEKLLFPVGEFTTYSTNIEIEKAKTENQLEKIEYLQTYNFGQSDKVYYKFIDYFYTRRKLAKDRKDKFESEFYKRIMNHLYGRFALHKDLKKLTRITAKNQDRIIPVTATAGYETVETSDKSKNFALAIYVTSYARVYLYDMLKRLNEKFDILYCDTDSCYFTSLDGEDMGNVIDYVYKNFDISNNLGGYSLNAYESGSFYNVKAYLLNKFSDEKKVKLKGIRADHRQEFLETGKTKYRKPVKMRSSLRSVKGISVNSWEEHEVSRRGTYDKRQVIPITEYLNKTKPLNITE